MQTGREDIVITAELFQICLKALIMRSAGLRSIFGKHEINNNACLHCQAPAASLLQVSLILTTADWGLISLLVMTQRAETKPGVARGAIFQSVD
jgi:hypothetical protein